MNVLARNINSIVIKSLATALERVAVEYRLDPEVLKQTFITDDLLVSMGENRKTPRPRTQKKKDSTKNASLRRPPSSTQKSKIVSLSTSFPEDVGDEITNTKEDKDSANNGNDTESKYYTEDGGASASENEITVEEIILDDTKYLKDSFNNLYCYDIENPKKIGILLANNRIKLITPATQPSSSDVSALFSE